MNQPVLVIMAAGLGSRYGGLKQIAPVDDAGHILMDFSLYDAFRAGFRKVVFIVAPHLEKDFREAVGDRIERHMQVCYAYQTLDILPEGFRVPDGRVKPWGTAHAVLSAKNLVDSNFAAINADDFYGAEAFRAIYRFLEGEAGESRQAMVGYQIGNTITENGYVARGICKTGEQGKLLEIVERTRIESRPGGGAYTEDGESYTFLPYDTVASMNLWGFGLSMMGEIENRFAAFLRENLPENPLKCEYFLPFVVNQMLSEGKTEVSVLKTPDKWYGVTYADDMPVVRKAIAKMKRDGTYPEFLWGGN